MNMLKWSKNSIQSEFGHCQSLSEVVKSLEQKLWSQDQVICQIHVNGLFLSELEEAKFANTKIGEIDELKIVAKGQKELTEDSVLSLLEWLPQVKELCLNVSEALRLQDAAAEKGFMNVVENVQYLSEALVLLRPRLLGEGRNDAYRQKWSHLEVQFREHTKELLAAFEKGDMILVGDILDYELTTLFESWGDFLKENL